MLFNDEHVRDISEALLPDDVFNEVNFEKTFRPRTLSFFFFSSVSFSVFIFVYFIYVHFFPPYI